MFNVYPVAVRYFRTVNTGILAGIPLQCTIGVADRVKAVEKVNELQLRNDGSLYDQFSIDYRK